MMSNGVALLLHTVGTYAWRARDPWHQTSHGLDESLIQVQITRI